MNPAAKQPSIVLGSRNCKKCREIAELLAPYAIEVASLADFPQVAEVVEDGRTFAENAAKKASEIARAARAWTLGEDSGLMVDALDGDPGILSARYSGPWATDQSNNAKLIAELAGVPEEKRDAKYVCSIAVADPSGKIRLQVEATCCGSITTKSRGNSGFGYDPHFLIREYGRTFGELSPLVKRVLSHRARALGRLIPQLVRLLRNELAEL